MLSDRANHIHAIRAAELDRILNHYESFFCGKDLLELGSGSGFHLKMLSSVCRSSVGLEIVNIDHTMPSTPGIIEYDGKHIPFPSASFDIIFSSQVLQYLTDEKQIYDEMSRMLRPGGLAIHIVPTSGWRFWTSVLHYPAKIQLLLTRQQKENTPTVGFTPKGQSSARLRRLLYDVLLLHRLGKHGNWLTEHFLFHSRAWRRKLLLYGWKVERIDPLGLWYSGHEMLGEELSLRSRGALARLLGSATAMILARPLTNLPHCTPGGTT